MDGFQSTSAQSGSAADLAADRFSPPPIQQRHGAGARRTWSDRPVGGAGKRAFDIVVSASALVALAPILGAVWMAVRLDSRGPGLFRQRRGGRCGRPFYIYKFRTMTTEENRSVAQAREGDNRVTPLGRFLRKNSIDELPQLINVLLGDMSIVGPRPHALAHDRQFSTLDRRYRERHRARPGITGLAQVSGARGLTDTEEKIFERTNYDIDYVARWSWLLDLGIIARTVLVVFRDRDAF
ncbi:MAG: exopolysaccharide biosynthesis protein [Alphaproteobacteria bacterium]|nr:exopolysaccharide biosynthesis protein [Alphaproteobacteria bacterium]